MRTHLTLLLLTLAATAPGRAADATNQPFHVGEKLTYQIYWGPLIAGKATLEVAGIEQVDGHDCYHLIAKAQTTGVVDLLYSINSRTESWLDVKELRTRRYRQDRHERNRHRSDDAIYDYANQQLLTTNLINGKTRSYPLDGPTQDMISCLYYVRTKPLKLDVAEQFPITLGSTRYDVTIKPDERKSLYFRPTGNIQALRLEPTPTLTFVASNNGRMWFWVSDDPRKLVLLITSDTKLGSAKFVLSKIEPGKAP